jgi:hypothetical protein
VDVVMTVEVSGRAAVELAEAVELIAQAAVDLSLQTNVIEPFVCP